MNSGIFGSFIRSMTSFIETCCLFGMGFEKRLFWRLSSADSFNKLLISLFSEGSSFSQSLSSIQCFSILGIIFRWISVACGSYFILFTLFLFSSLLKSHPRDLHFNSSPSPMSCGRSYLADLLILGLLNDDIFMLVLSLSLIFTLLVAAFSLKKSSERFSSKFVNSILSIFIIYQLSFPY
ncbi:unnamed protein product [Moneuplotes crassus]|uniref:Uncharacterized protein n=1 Tax=Euplotes crassus TaxID=5936 RepID=A0AAD1UB84_EUPCR|nr:unnamed protein product [Moneuplotes crassus]